MAHIKDTEYKSTNPIIQKCLDILNNPDIKIEETSKRVSTVIVDKKIVFLVSDLGLYLPDNITFYVDRMENGMDFSDIPMIWEKTREIVQSHETEKVQKALNLLESEPKKEQGKKKKNNKIQYAVPYEVSEVQEYLNAEKGLVGYNVNVKFKDVSCFPYPSFLDYENVHIYTDDNAGTSQVVYHFPFIGYGIINYGKLAAKHWYKKMKKQADTYNMQQKTK